MKVDVIVSCGAVLCRSALACLFFAGAAGASAQRAQLMPATDVLAGLPPFTAVHTVAATPYPKGAASESVVAEDPQVKDDLFDGLGLEKLAAKAKESNEVTMDKDTLRMAGKQKKFAGKVDLVNVRNYEFEKDGEYNMADLETLQKRLEGGGWSHMVRNRTKTEINDICVKRDNEGQMTEMVIINAEPRELNLVHLRGHLTMDDLKKYGADVDSGDDDSSRPDPKLKKH